MPKIPPLPEPVEEDSVTEKLGINVYDLQRIDPGMYQKLLADRLDLRKEALIRLKDSKPDEVVVPFLCQTREAALVCDILRSESRREGDEPVRIYINRGKAWTRLAGAIILSLPGDKSKGQSSRLNPEVFGSQIKYAPVLPKTPKRIEL